MGFSGCSKSLCLECTDCLYLKLEFFYCIMYSFQSIKFELVLQPFFQLSFVQKKKTICFYTRENICGPQCKVWRAQISLINVFHKLCSACACTPRVCALYCNMPRIIWLYAAILYFVV